VYDSLADAAAALISGGDALEVHEVLGDDSVWDPFRFVDLCQRYADTDSTAEQVCRQIARAEWQLLFDDCYRKAIA
jgi:hypothetical protein